MMKITLSKLVQNMMRVDLLIDEEPMEQQLNNEPSFLEVEEQPSAKDPKECVLPIISISPHNTLLDVLNNRFFH